MQSVMITPKTAIMPVHLYGHPVNMPEIMAIAQKHGLMVFEDAAQAHAASIDGARSGAGTFPPSASTRPRT